MSGARAAQRGLVELLSVSQVATTLGVTPSTVYRYISDPLNPLPARRVPKGRRTLIRHDDLMDWLEPIKADDIEREADRLLRRFS